MIRAEYKDRSSVVDILASSFEDNKSVNYVIPQIKDRKQRIRRLMEYSFDVCYIAGKIFLSEDKKGCALVMLPDMKKTSFRSIWLDLKLIVTCIGLFNSKKALVREARIKKLQPKGPVYYLWFIAVDPAQQGRGTGSKLLNEIIRESEAEKRPVCLETSTLKNLPWYRKSGFTVYNEMDLGYKLFFLKRDVYK
jgi:hypothetical protein